LYKVRTVRDIEEKVVLVERKDRGAEKNLYKVRTVRDIEEKVVPIRKERWRGGRQTVLTRNAKAKQ